jgi:hypothetical protein
MMKIDKTGGTATRIFGAPGSQPFVVHGGNIYMMGQGAASGGGSAGLATACK